MRSWAMGVLIGTLLILASMNVTTAQSSPPEEPPTRTVEIPGAGAVVTLPREWRIWAPELLDGRPAGVWTEDLTSGWTCQMRSHEDLVSAQAEGDKFIEGAEYIPGEVSVTEPVEVATGNAVGVTFGSPERDPQHIVFVDAPESVVRFTCGSAPVDFHLDVARAIAPLPADYSAEPFDPRVEIADHGFAVDFGVEWRVSSRARHLAARLGGTTVLGAHLAAPKGGGTPVARCLIEDDSDVPGLLGLTSAGAWGAAFVAAEGRPGRWLTTAVVDLPSGPAIRAHWARSGTQTTAWVVSDDEHVVVLLCSSKRPPKDRWRSVAETIELLPAEE